MRTHLLFPIFYSSIRTHLLLPILYSSIQTHLLIISHVLFLNANTSFITHTLFPIFYSSIQTHLLFPIFYSSMRMHLIFLNANTSFISHVVDCNLLFIHSITKGSEVKSQLNSLDNPGYLVRYGCGMFRGAPGVSVIANF